MDDVDVIDLGEAGWTIEDLRRPLPRHWRRVIALAVVAALSLTLGASERPVKFGPLWTADGQAMAVGPRTVYTMTVDGTTLEAREPRTGHVRWSVAGLGAIADVRDYGRGIVAVSRMSLGGPSSGTIMLLDADTGLTVGTAPGQLTAVVADGSVLVALQMVGGCSTGVCANIAGLSGRDGAPLWSLPYEPDSAWLWGVGDPALAAIRSDGEVRRYDLSTGRVTITWRADWQGFDAVGAARNGELFLSSAGDLVGQRVTDAGTVVRSVSPRPANDWTFVIPAPSKSRSRYQTGTLGCQSWICVVIVDDTFIVLDPVDGHVVVSASSWIYPFGRLPLLAQYEADRTTGTVTSLSLVDPETGAVRSVLHGEVTEVWDSPGDEQLVMIHPSGVPVANILAVAADGATRLVGTIASSLYCWAASEILLCFPMSRDGSKPPAVLTAWPMPR
jgi:hypothetical protein